MDEGFIGFNTLLDDASLNKLTKHGKTSLKGNEYVLLQKLNSWKKRINSLSPSLKKERKLESPFIKSIMCDALNHLCIGDDKEVSLISQDSNGRPIPDLKLGRFMVESRSLTIKPKMLLELKSPSCINFWAQQHSRPDKKSAIEQVVSDMFNENETCEFAVVTNLTDFELLSRKYADKRSLTFSIERISTLDDVRLFYALLGLNSYLITSDKIQIDFRKNEDDKKQISKEFYEIFKSVRQKLCEICVPILEDENINPFVTKVLAQFVFILYGETIGLLPRDSLLRVLEMGGYKWNTYRKFAKAIDKGAMIEGLGLFGYNGGLFADTPLYRKKVPNTFLKAAKPLLNFQFKNRDGVKVSVEEIRDILGRVLEFTLEINTVENLYNFTDEGTFAEARKKQASRNERQQKGAFYTKRFLTKYMVSEAITLLNEANVNLSKSTWLDPACGSGAFLLEVFEQLKTHEMRKHGLKNEMLGKNLKFDKLLSDFESQVLGRIHGYDFDAFAVGLSQLNLSLNCCRPNEKLPVLEGTVTETDFLLDTKKKETYDVIIANPPYMQWRYIPTEYRDKLSENKMFSPLANSSSDYSTFFFKKAYEALKPGGVLCFVATNKLLSSQQHETFRKWLLALFDLHKLLDFRSAIFQGTAVETAVYILKRPKTKKKKKAQGEFQDVYSFSKSETHLEEFLVNTAPLELPSSLPYTSIPTKTTPALLHVGDWLLKNKSKFVQVKDIFNSKAGMRITDIPPADRLDRKPPKNSQKKYEPLYDGTCLNYESMKLIPPPRWSRKDSTRMQRWRQELEEANNQYILVKELSSKPAISAVSGKCPAALNSISILYPKSDKKLELTAIAEWLKSPFVESIMELYFGPNRHHATQRWKNVYTDVMPLLADPKKDNIPAWVEKECMLYLDGEFRDIGSDGSGFKVLKAHESIIEETKQLLAQSKRKPTKKSSRTNTRSHKTKRRKRNSSSSA